MSGALVIMGVAGCGKSSLAADLAAALGWSLIEGDAHHSAGNLEKMRTGVPLTDGDRLGWLAALAQRLATRPATDGIVLTCSALKRSYREQLRSAAPGLRFVFLDIGPGTARQRVLARGPGHFFSAALVDNQFSTLEPPTGEPGVLHLDGTLPRSQLQAAVLAWVHTPEAA